jgi:hypothetical protein
MSGKSEDWDGGVIYICHDLCWRWVWRALDSRAMLYSRPEAVFSNSSCCIFHTVEQTIPLADQRPYFQTAHAASFTL